LNIEQRKIELFYSNALGIGLVSVVVVYAFCVKEQAGAGIHQTANPTE